MKTEVYSWRLSPELKSNLEREARRRKLSVSAILALAARDWLDKSTSNTECEDEQLRLREAALSCCGTFAGADPHRAENVRQTLRQRLRQRHDR